MKKLDNSAGDHQEYLLETPKELKHYRILDNWMKLGCPRIWYTVETFIYGDDKYEAQLDYGHGGCRLCLNGNMVAVGQNEAVSEHVIMLDVNHHSASRYLWVRANNEPKPS